MATPTQIRTATIATLVAANTSAAGRIFDTRLDPWDDAATFPALSVSSQTGAGDPASVDFPAYRRTDELSVLGAVSPGPTVGQTAAQADAALAAAVDALEGEILRALARNAAFLAFNAGRPPAFRVSRGGSSASARRIGQVEILFTLTQQTVDYEPPEVDETNSLEQIRVETDLATADDVVDVTQDITLDGDP